MTISPPERGSDAKSQVEKVDNPATFELFGKPGHFDRALAKGPKTTTWVWNLHANAHDFDAHTSDLQEVSRRIFSAHFGHLAVIFIWLSGAFFHGARFSNYSGWLADPTHVKPSAQQVWAVFGQEVLNGDMGAGFQGIQITSGLFQMWRAWGITSETQLMALAIGALVMAGLMLNAGVFHYHKAAPKLEWFQNVESMLNHHLAGLLGLGSLSWAGHVIHVSAPVTKLMDAIDAGQPLVLNGKTIASAADIPLPHEFFNQDLLAQLYPGFSAGVGAFFSGNWAAYSDFLTFKGGLNPVTGSLWMTDIAHHHVAIAVMFIVAGHMYRTNWGIGHSIKEIHEGQKGDPLLFPATNGHDGLYDFMTNSWHAQLAVNLAIGGSVSIIVAQNMYAMPPYPYQAIDYPTQIGLFTHHIWIGGFLIVGAGAHAAIAMVRDYDPAKHIDNVLDRVLKARDAIISHLNWVCIWLGAHSFGLYIHNDTMRALGRPQDMFSDSAISIQPICAQWIQTVHAAAAGSTAPNALASKIKPGFGSLGTGHRKPSSARAEMATPADAPLADAPRDDGYALEDKLAFLQACEREGVAVTPWLRQPRVVVKHRNEEGGLGFATFSNAVCGGEWILQKALDNAPEIARLLPDNAPLSTLRLVSASRAASAAYSSSTRAARASRASSRLAPRRSRSQRLRAGST